MEPDFSEYEIIMLSTSGGKDSQAMLSYVTGLARDQGAGHKVIAIHADLGRVEWEGTESLARQQAELLGVPFHVVSRIGKSITKDGKTYRAGERAGDLLDYVSRRGSWPDARNRFCTSDFKRAPIRAFATRLADEYRAKNPHHRGPVRILDCQGLRAEESSARAALVDLTCQRESGRLRVDTWLPIHGWAVEQVWEEIKRSGLPHHPAYDKGMTRLSCVFCIFAPKKALLIAGRENPELLAEYVRVEQETGHKFKANLALADIAEELGQVVAPAPAPARSTFVDFAEVMGVRVLQ